MAGSQAVALAAVSIGLGPLERGRSNGRSNVAQSS